MIQEGLFHVYVASCSTLPYWAHTHLAMMSCYPVAKLAFEPPCCDYTTHSVLFVSIYSRGKLNDMYCEDNSNLCLLLSLYGKQEPSHPIQPHNFTTHTTNKGRLSSSHPVSLGLIATKLSPHTTSFSNPLFRACATTLRLTLRTACTVKAEDTRP